MSRTWISAVVLATALSGCVTTESFHRGPKEEMPTGPVHQVHATWESRPMVTQDVVNQGKPLVGIAGRLYLFGQELGRPIIGDGVAIIDLHDVTPETTAGEPKLLERWEIDSATLRRLAKKDTIGWGYTLFLPWSTQKPEVTRIQLQVRYAPNKGLPLFSPPAVLTLRTEAAPVIHQRQVVATGNQQQDKTAPAQAQTAAPARPQSSVSVTRIPARANR